MPSAVLYFKTCAPTATAPSKATPKSAGYDLCSAHNYVIPEDTVVVIDTQLQLIFPSGCYGRIASRSGLAYHHRIDVKAGVIDSDYTGTVKVLLYNRGRVSFSVRPGDRVAQLILERYIDAVVQEVDQIPETSRGSQGFGSTGYN